MSSDVPTSELLTGGGTHQCFRLDRNDRRGGGVAVFTPSNYNAAVLFSEHSGCCEALMIQIERTCVACVYRPPNNEHNVPALCTLLDNMQRTAGTSSIIVVGDFNLPGVLWPATDTPQLKPTATPNDKYFYEYMTVGAYSQLVSQPTRGCNYLDLCLTTTPTDILDVIINPPFAASDHLSLEIQLKPQQQQQQQQQEQQTSNKVCLNWLKADFGQLAACLQQVSWLDHLDASTSVQQHVDMVTTIINDVSTLLVPTKSTTTAVRRRRPDRTFERLRRAKQRLFKRVRAYRSVNPTNRLKRLDEAMRKRTLLLRKLEEERLATTSSSSFWQFVKRNVRDKPKQISIKTDAGVLSDSQLVANHLSHHYASVCQPDNSTTTTVNITNNNIVQTTDVLITEPIIHHYMTKLKPKLSCGVDNIPTRLLVRCSDQLSTVLTTIFRVSMITGVVPEQWRRAIIVPIPKKKLNTTANDYRPISITSAVCRLLERVIKDALVQHMVNNNLFTPAQHGFMAKRSIETCMLESLSDWTAIINKRRAVDVFYADISKAFDTVPHTNLLHKLKTYGIGGRLLTWLTNYLTDRQQSVNVNDCYSEWRPVTSGVPQGSCLGPVLFAIYINDLPTHLLNTTIKMFADDTKFYREINSDHDRRLLQRDIDLFCKWADDNQLNIASHKCFVLHIGGRNQQYNYNINNTLVTSTTSVRDLGFTVDAQLKWAEHTQQTARKAATRANMIFKVFKRRQRSFLLTMFKTFVRPVTEYGTSVWNPSTDYNRNIIEKIQRRYTKRMFPSNSTITYEQRLEQLQLKTLTQRRAETDIIVLHKIINNHISCNIQLHHVHRQSRGHQQRLRRTKSNNNTMKNSFPNRSINNWNMLPSRLVETTRAKTFKKALRGASLSFHS